MSPCAFSVLPLRRCSRSESCPRPEGDAVHGLLPIHRQDDYRLALCNLAQFRPSVVLIQIVFARHCRIVGSSDFRGSITQPQCRPKHSTSRLRHKRRHETIRRLIRGTRPRVEPEFPKGWRQNLQNRMPCRRSVPRHPLWWPTNRQREIVGSAGQREKARSRPRQKTRKWQPCSRWLPTGTH